MSTPTITEPVRPGSPELAALLARIADGAEERELDRTPPFEQIGWIKEAGLGRLRLPVDQGGAGATVREFFATLIALGEADANIAHILRVHFSFVEQVLQSEDPEYRARWTSLINEGNIFGNGATCERSRRTTRRT